MSEHTIRTIRHLLESDRDERQAERQLTSGDNEGYITLIGGQLRKNRHLGPLDTEEWRHLITVTKNQGYGVYVAYARGSNRQFHRMSILKLFEMSASGLTAKETTLDIDKNGITITDGKWSAVYMTRHQLNQYITRDTHSRLILSPMDLEKASVKQLDRAFGVRGHPGLSWWVDH